MGFLSALKYPVAIIGTIGVIALGWVIHAIGRKLIDRSVPDPKEHYRKLSFLTTAIVIIAVAIVIILWARPMQHTGTFLGLIGAGVAVALRDPLLSVAGRIAIFSGNIYSVGDRIEINKMTGDVIDVGFFYTRMMEIGNWITADQASGRVVQFSNSRVFGHAVFNYTQNFSYIWDEAKLPITYDSDVQQAQQLLLEAGREYSKEFLQGARRDLEEMRRHALVPEFELEPAVYMKVTSNYIELTMRYVVDPKKRRSASTFIYAKVFDGLKAHPRISIGSDTMDLTVHPPEKAPPENERQPARGAGIAISKQVVAESRQQDQETQKAADKDRKNPAA